LTKVIFLARLTITPLLERVLGASLREDDRVAVG